MKKITSAIVLLIIFPFFSSADTIFSPINEVKKNIPSKNKGRVWYDLNKWNENKIDNDTWEVKVSDAVWRVSKTKKFCAQNGIFVSLCSKNGTAKKYSGILYCVPLSLCEVAQNQSVLDNLFMELKKIDFSKLTYTEAQKDGWTYTIVNEIPKSVRMALSQEIADYERKNQNATYKDTCSFLYKKYGIPEKAAMAIYGEGPLKGWGIKPWK